MKAKIISFDEVLERMKTGNIKNICIVDLKTYRLRKWALW